MIDTKSLASHCTFTRTDEAPCELVCGISGNRGLTMRQCQRTCHRTADVHTAPEPHLHVVAAGRLHTNYRCLQRRRRSRRHRAMHVLPLRRYFHLFKHQRSCGLPCSSRCRLACYLWVLLTVSYSMVSHAQQLSSFISAHVCWQLTTKARRNRRRSFNFRFCIFRSCIFWFSIFSAPKLCVSTEAELTQRDLATRYVST